MDTEHPLLAPARYVYYRWVRNRLPRRVGVFNGVAAKRKALAERSGNRAHEEALCRGIAAVVEPGDTVVVIGAGAGVSAVHASVMAGQEGCVLVYEATESQVATAEETIGYNVTPANVEVTHAAVGEVADHSVEKYGVADGGTVAVDDLPACDVLVSDCEGAERTLLENLQQRPRAMVVESHGFAGAPTEWVLDQLVELNYDSEVIGTELEPEDVRIVEARRR